VISFLGKAWILRAHERMVKLSYPSRREDRGDIEAYKWAAFHACTDHSPSFAGPRGR
jgi:hypothetical protein